MNVIITGASGLLGRAVVAEFKRKSWKVLGLAHTRARHDLVRIDITDNDAVSSIVREFKPHAIIHCAAERSPENVETDPDRYYSLNVEVPGKLAKLAAEVKAVFVFISSDYVFSGNNSPYAEDDSTFPLNSYGSQKAGAERKIVKANPNSCILRIPVIYGGEQYVEESAVSCLLNAVKSGAQAEVSNVEIRFPSHTSDVAAIIYQLVQKKIQDPSLKHVIYHWCGSEPFTKYEMARVIAETFGLHHGHLTPLNVPSPGVLRPKNVQLICDRLENLGIRQHTRFVEGIAEFRKFLA